MKIEPVTPQKVLELAQALSANDLVWLIDQLNRLAADLPLPESTTLDEAITLFLADQCSLGRAAELAGVTRWDIMDAVAARGLPVQQDAEMTSDEMNSQFKELEQLGML